MNLKAAIEEVELEVQVNNLITLEEFKTIMNHIKENYDDNEKLTRILVSDDCTGFTNFGEHLVCDLLHLVEKLLNDDGDWISWWLYEDVSKIVTSSNTNYDLTKVEDLYYFLRKEYDKVKREDNNG
jgi:hypothetical protein